MTNTPKIPVEQDGLMPADLADAFEAMATFGGELGTIQVAPEFTRLVLAALRTRPTPTEAQAVSGELVEEIESGIRIAIWNTAKWQGKADEVAQSFIRHAMDEPCMKRALSSLPHSAEAQSGLAAFQAGVDAWMDVCFGEAIKADIQERSDRFIEEALEFVQATGYAAERAHALVDYTFGRPQGEINQEVGGVMVTLAAMCNTLGVDIGSAAETELARVWTKVDQIRAKQAAKPTGSALPVRRPASVVEGVEAEAPCTDCDDTGITIQTERFCSCEAGHRARAASDTKGEGNDTNPLWTSEDNGRRV